MSGTFPSIAFITVRSIYLDTDNPLSILFYIEKLDSPADSISLLDTDHTDNRFIGISCFSNTTYTKKTLLSLISGKRIDIAPLRGAWDIYFYNQKPLLLFCQEDTFSHTITVYSEANGINYHTLRWNRTSDTDPNLYKNEKLYIQWFLYLAYYLIKPAKQSSEPILTEAEILTKFIVNFCEITDNPKASFPSEPFYEQWITDYYKQNGRAPIGYKKFNRFLRQYGDGQINVKSKHITRGKNTQHIYGLVFNQQKYESARAKSVKAPDLLLKQLEELLPVIEAMVKDIEIDIKVQCIMQSTPTPET